MLNFKVWNNYALMLLISLNIIGCSSINNQNKPEKTRMLGVPVATVETDPAILELEAAVRKSPENADAWSRLTKAYFDGKRYDQAVQAGNMALQINPENVDTRNIVFVSGLRIASASLDGIRKDQPLTGSNLSDAETLVGTIRQTLGGTSLTETSTKPKQEKSAVHHTAKKKIRYVKHKRIETDDEDDSDATAPAPKPILITNKPVGATNPVAVAKPIIAAKPIVAAPKPVPKPATQAAANNPFGAFQ